MRTKFTELPDLAAPMHTASLSQKDALLIIDMQNDFLPGGTLAVNSGKSLIPVINSIIERFTRKGLTVYASRDWHPAAHCSFREQGGPWPPHCIAETLGAEFAPGLDLPPSTRIISKGSEIGRDAYSAFEGTTLASCLRSDGIERVFVCGLTTEYCVRSTAEDAAKQGFAVVVVSDAIGAIEEHAGDSAKAIAKMQQAGAVIRCYKEIVA